MTENLLKSTDLPGPHSRWYLAAGLVIAMAAAAGAVAWPALPQSLPMHWNGSGEVDSYADKSLWTVFTGPLIGAGLVVFLYATALGVRRLPLNNSAPYGVDEEVHQRAGMDATLYFLALTAFALSLLLAWMSLRTWFLPPDASVLFLALPTLGFLAMMAGAGLLALRRYRRLTGYPHRRTDPSYR